MAHTLHRVTHQDVIAESVVRDRHLVALSFLQLMVVLGPGSRSIVADHGVVGRHVPALHAVHPGGDVEDVRDQIRIVRPSMRRRHERDDVHRIVEKLREAAVFRAKGLGISHQTLFHQVGERPNQKHTSLREGEVTQHGEEEIAELDKEAALNTDNGRALFAD